MNIQHSIDLTESEKKQMITCFHRISKQINHLKETKHDVENDIKFLIKQCELSNISNTNIKYILQKLESTETLECKQQTCLKLKSQVATFLFPPIVKCLTCNHVYKLES